MHENIIIIAKEKRAYALDALRGFAILAMVLSGTIKYKILPAWMYHAQEPPPTHTFHPNLPGFNLGRYCISNFLVLYGSSYPLGAVESPCSRIHHKTSYIIHF
jgi:uncharacterized membrane protein